MILADLVVGNIIRIKDGGPDRQITHIDRINDLFKVDDGAGWRAPDAIEEIVSRLSLHERQLATLLWNARTALWREWIEAGSQAAKQAYDATDPKDVI